MSNSKIYTVIGLMSGTSLDGVDAALIKTDGINIVEPIGQTTLPYPENLKQKMRECLGKDDLNDPDVVEVERLVTFHHAQAVKDILEQEQISASQIDLIGFHGQTIFHDPDNQITLQIGDGDLLAHETGINVVNDFRSADVKAGGQGAPFLPLYHRARVKLSGADLPVVILNLGGVSNITWIGQGDDDIVAFDTGPGNALIDDFVFERTGDAFDVDGRLASYGRVHRDIVNQWMELPFFDLPVPKSLDRNVWDVSAVQALDTTDGVATLTAFTVESIRAAKRFLPDMPNCWYVAGGGRHNKAIMQGLADSLMSPVKSVDDLGWNGDALEAEGFAYLAVRSVKRKPLSLPSTTGVPEPVTGGVLHEVA